MNVLRTSHRGIVCALPADQVLGAVDDVAGQMLQLWPEPAARGMPQAADTDGRVLMVATSAGSRPLRCLEPKLVELPAGAAQRLSPVLKGVLGLPHVVGWMELDGELVWLVDLMRWSPTGQGNSASL